MTTRCRSGKIRYRDRIGAQLALADLTRRDDTARPKTEVRIYHCPRCCGWHLTSQRRKVAQ